MPPINEFVSAAWSVMLELAPWLLVGVFIAGLLHVLVSREWIREKLSGGRGVLRGVLFGVPLPLCSCGVIPAGMGLKKDGASDGATVAFLTSTPQTGVDSILVSGSMLGWPFALFKVGAALVTGITGGLLTESLADTPADSEPSEIDEQTATRPEKPRGVQAKVTAGILHMVDVLESIWGWLLFGVVLAALISVLAPASGWAVFSEIGIWPSMILVLGLSTPLYVCATASVPIAAALVAAGMPTGAALVFLMAGPATNVATIGAIYRTLGRRNLIVYLVNIVVGSLVLGWVFQGVISPDIVADAVHSAHVHNQWWRVVAAVLLSLFFVWFAFRSVQRRVELRRMESGSDTSENTVEIDVDGMSCNNCVSKLTRNLNALDGVEKAVVTLNPGHAVIQGTVSVTRIRETIENSGFQPQK